MNKLEQAAREVIRQHSMECLSDKTVDALREALAVSEQRMEEQAEHTPYCKQAPMCKTPCGNPDCVEQAEQDSVLYPVRRGSRITCIESGEKCVVWATSHTDCWVQFPDGHAGQYTYEQIGKYFSIEENQAADEAYERGSKECIEAGKKTEQAEQEPTVSDGVCGGCAKKAADGWALYCVECWEKAEQPVSQEYQDHLVNQSFDWAAMAAKHQFMEGYRIGLAEMREKCAKVCDDKHDYMCSRAAAAIRAIRFEGDTGFRPVSEMVAEHKQDPKKAAAIEKAKMRKAEQEPVAWRVRGYNQFKTGNPAPWRYVDGADKPTVNKPDCCDFEPLYAAPVRTKDLTDDEIWKVWDKVADDLGFARAVIAADREKNK